MSEYPRALSDFELFALRTLLPEDRAGYREFHQRLLTAKVIGEGRWGTGDLVLGNEISEIDLTAGMTPVVAYGEFKLKSDDTITLSVHTPELDQMEVHFSEDASLVGKNALHSHWTYSNWSPGLSDPGSTTFPRPLELKDSAGKLLFVLAVSTTHHSIWIYHSKSGFNQLLPLTGFYEYLLRSKPQVSAAKSGFQPKVLFEQLSEFSDQNLRDALLHYNQENRKFDASQVVAAEAKTPSGLLKILTGIFKRSHD